MTDCPAPFLPAEVDLRGYDFMPLHVTNLRQSGFAARVSGDEFRAGTMLWSASWHEVPAASVPNDDYELAKLAGYGFAVAEWKKLRSGALYGFTLCSDGRLYHRVVAAVAWDSWLERLKHHWAAECDRTRAHNKRWKDDAAQQRPVPTFPVYVRGQYPATARRLDDLDQLTPPQGWLILVEGKKRVRRTRLPSAPEGAASLDECQESTDETRKSERQGGKIGEHDTLYIGETEPHRQTVHPVPLNSPSGFALKREGERDLSPPSPPDRGGDLAGLPEGFEGKRPADFLSFYRDWGDATAPMATVARAWCEVEPDIPARDRLAAALAEFRRLNAAKTQGCKPPPMIGPARFLRERQWAALLVAVDAANAGANAKLATFRANWGDLAEGVLAALGEALVLAWLAEASPRMLDGRCIITMRHSHAVSMGGPRIERGLRKAFPAGFELVAP